MGPDPLGHRLGAVRRIVGEVHVAVLVDLGWPLAHVNLAAVGVLERDVQKGSPLAVPPRLRAMAFGEVRERPIIFAGKDRVEMLPSLAHLPDPLVWALLGPGDDKVHLLDPLTGRTRATAAGLAEGLGGRRRCRTSSRQTCRPAC